MTGYAVANVLVAVFVGLSFGADIGVTFFLLALAVLRVYSLYRSAWWIWHRGRAFRELWDDLTTGDKREIIYGTSVGKNRLYELYLSTGGLFFPFGVKGVVSQRWRDAGRFRSAKGLVDLLWKFYIFAPVWSVGITVYAVVHHQPSERAFALVALASTVMMFGCFSIGLEAALSYLVLGGWSVAYHQLSVSKDSRLTEFAAYVGGALSVFMTTQATVMVLARQSFSFTAIPPDTPALDVVGLSYYYAVSTLTGNGDPGPVGFWAHFITAVAFALGVVYLVIVISLLFDAVGASPRTSAVASPQQMNDSAHAGADPETGEGAGDSSSDTPPGN